jgi:sRNA-binding carbon storage regulator CsrA
MALVLTREAGSEVLLRTSDGDVLIQVERVGWFRGAMSAKIVIHAPHVISILRDDMTRDKHGRRIAVERDEHGNRVVVPRKGE